MKLVGALDDRRDADLFETFLDARGFRSAVDSETGKHRVFVFDDNNAADAAEHLREFQLSPDRAYYVETAKRHREEQKAKSIAKTNRNEATLREQRPIRPLAEQVPATILLVATCLAVFLVAKFGGPYGEWTRSLVISNAGFAATQAETPIGLIRFTKLPEVAAGEVWRLVTPILLHNTANAAHIVFNMLWLVPLGSAIEYRRGSIRFVLMIAVLAALSNLIQFAHAGPNFVGISGVVTGLFGYVWIYGVIAPEEGIGIDAKTTAFMLLYLGVCLADLVPNAANWSHLAGLVAGVGLAFVSIGVRRAKERPLNA